MHLVRFFFRAGDYHFFEVKKTMHLIKQLDETDCGAACIAMIARVYKSSYPVTRIREIAGTDRQGINLAGMVQVRENGKWSKRG